MRTESSRADGARLSAALLCVVVVAAACGGRGDTPEGADPAVAGQLTDAQRSRFHIAPVASARFTPAVDVTGTVDFDGDRSTQVLSSISGPVTNLLVEPGARVAAGDPLAYVASPDFADNIAAYRKAEVALLNAQRVVHRDSALFANDALARQDLEQAETDASSAAADRDAALEGLRALGADSATVSAIQHGQPVVNAHGVIRAPIAGEVVERLVTPGQLLQAGSTPCFTIAEMSTVWVMANVFESDLADVHVGDPADITLTLGGEAFHGRVDYVAAEVDADTRATGVRIATTNRDGLLKKAMYVRVTLHSRRERSGLLIPVSAVLRDSDNLPFVFQQTAEGFTRKPVQLGLRLGDRYEIKSGLAAGDSIVTEGGLFLQFAANQ